MRFRQPIGGTGNVLQQVSLTLRQRLKQATNPAHLALESLIGPLDSMAAYADYLRGMQCFRTQVEASLPPLADFTPLKLSGLLSGDLNDLHLTPHTSDTQRAMAPGESYALGAHYVLEGSALGARILCKIVEPLGLNAQHGARHLWAQAASLQNWRDFVALLDEREDADFDQVAAGANAMFEAASRAMQSVRIGC